MAASHQLPPGPRFPGLLQTFLIWRRWLWFLHWCRRRYGGTFKVKAMPMGDIVYVSDPEHIKQVFTGDRSLLHAGEANSFLGPVMGDRSLLLLDEDEHLSQRKLMLPSFHGEAVRRYGEMVRSLTEEEVARWPLGRAFPLLPAMQAITLEVILRAVFGVEERRRLADLRRLLPQVVMPDPVLQLMWMRPELGRVGRWRKFLRLKEEMDGILFDEIAQRRRDPGLEERTDVLSLLIRARADDGRTLTDVELRDQLVTLLLAGHETTATGLAWAFERLLRHPRALERLRTETAAGDEAYADAVVKETLRVRPVIADVVRKLTADADIAGYRLPAGTIVAPAIGLVHFDRDYYEEPGQFRPERFLEGNPDSYTWISFGGGPRRCLGAAFASLEMRVVLTTVLERVELRAARPEPEEIRVSHITLVPEHGSEVVVERVRDEAERGAEGAASLTAAAR